MPMKHTHTDTAGKTETFWTRNVRLITFLICIAVFLAVFGPVSVFHIHKYINEQSDARTEMTLNDLRRLSSAPMAVRTSDLDRFVGEVGSNTAEGVTYTVYQIDIGDRYFLMASFEEAFDRIYYMTLTDLRTQTELDLLKDAKKLESFLSAQQN